MLLSRENGDPVYRTGSLASPLASQGDRVRRCSHEAPKTHKTDTTAYNARMPGRDIYVDINIIWSKMAATPSPESLMAKSISTAVSLLCTTSADTMTWPLSVNLMPLPASRREREAQRSDASVTTMGALWSKWTNPVNARVSVPCVAGAIACSRSERAK